VFPPETTPGPDQLKVAPGVDELAEIDPLVVIQSRVSGEPAVTFGGVMFAVTVTVAVLVQPFNGSVTVTTYDPAPLITGLEVVDPETMNGPVHEYGTPPVEEEAEIVLTIQVIV
jgi:hypothetical protein